MGKDKIKLRFAPGQTSPTLEVNNGEYSRKFEANDQPFECDQSEAEFLLRTGYFVVASVGLQSKDKSAKNKEQSSESAK